MQRLLGIILTASAMVMAGCHTCDVCDDCGDCGGCGGRSYHARHYGDPGFAPGYVIPEGGEVIGAKTKSAPTTRTAAKPKTTKPTTTTPVIR
jgi:hypothetical protein